MIDLLRRTKRTLHWGILRARHAVERRVAGTRPPPPITARACHVIDQATRLPIFSKNATVRLAPASLTKLATCILLARASRERWDERVEVQPADLAGGSTMGLIAGESVSRRDILLGMLLPSGNDAAQLAARLVGPDWLEQMNGLCAELGMRRTRFRNPHGQDQRGQKSCARDLSLLAAAAFADPVIAAAAGLRRHLVNGRELLSTVEMLGEGGVRCGKTGSSLAAGACLAIQYRSSFICLLGSQVAFDHGYVVARTDRRYDDARRIMRALDALDAGNRS
uniref:D-alanyl-D-alanine carboxypeptidase family protein n=1 Tax=uncultured Sphingomonas sp. TaxID=158754 RepID=UPI0025D14C54|nr:serine hydrolase [uncultured Sphingomonas sp.]